jgi:hypothetical protein
MRRFSRCPLIAASNRCLNEFHFASRLALADWWAGARGDYQCAARGHNGSHCLLTWHELSASADLRSTSSILACACTAISFMSCETRPRKEPKAGGYLLARLH